MAKRKSDTRQRRPDVQPADPPTWEAVLADLEHFGVHDTHRGRRDDVVLLAIFDLILATRKPPKPTDVARHTGFPLSTVGNATTTLVLDGLVHRLPRRAGYVPTQAGRDRVKEIRG